MSHVTASREGPLARLEMDFRGALNLMDGEAIDALGSALTSLEEAQGLRVVLLSGAAGKPFVGGADLLAMRDLEPGAARTFISSLTDAFSAVRKLAVPVVAAIEGYALGAGLELAMACDVRVAEAGARFGMPEVRVGVPSVIEAALLPRFVGLGRAQYLLYTGAMIDALEAERIGLVDKLAPQGVIRDVARAVADDIAACSPAAVRAQKRLLRRWQEMPLDAGIAAGVEEFARTFETEDPREGMTAFLERRPPRYKD